MNRPACILVVAILASPGFVNAQATKPPDFEKEIAPILIRRCLECHNAGDEAGGLNLTTHATLTKGGESGAVIDTKNLASSELLRHVAEGTMPPKKRKRLTPKELASLKAWVLAAAAWPKGRVLNPLEFGTEQRAGRDWWSLRPVQRPRLPDVRDSLWPRDPIDAFTLAKMRQQRLSPSSAADRRTLIRRMSLVIRGLPPTAEEVTRFLSDQRPDAYGRLVNRMLADPRYGERWARHWLDIARFAETNGFETNTPRPNAWRYRDYVIRAFNDDKPYDRFVKEQLAGDALGSGAATGFLVAGSYDTVKSPDINLTLMQRQDELHDMVNATSTAFLGMTVACARCHNHKFDPILQTDYYAMQAVLAGVRHGDRKIANPVKAVAGNRIAEVQQKLQTARDALSKIEAGRKTQPRRGGLIVLDEESHDVELITPKTGQGVNPAGTGRGHKNDAGTISRLPNISGGRYTWWKAKPQADLIAYRPRATGEFRIWLSWGCGPETHATDAAYFLDVDGDLKTQNDRRLIARVDQRKFADSTQPSVNKPLWGGLRDVGVHRLAEKSCIMLRSGKVESAVSADVVILERVTKDVEKSVALPRLRDAVNAHRNEERFAPVAAKFVRFTVQETNSGQPCLDELEVWSTEKTPRNVALSVRGATATSSGNYPGNKKHTLAHIHDGRYGNSRSWISNQTGKGWVEIEFAEPTRIDRIVWGRDRQQKYTDRLATRYRIDVAATRGVWKTVASNVDRLPAGVAARDVAAYRFAGLKPAQQVIAVRLHEQIRQWESTIASLSASVVSYAGTFQQPGVTHRLHRGDPLIKREVVPPGALTAIAPSLGLTSDSPERQRRLALANWIADGRHPLTARVMVNRIWQHHFGRGIVATPGDFGKMGVPPSHPQLLDWLAREFVESGWSVKHVQRLILHSATWRQSSRPRGDAMNIDASAQWLWRFPPRRLEAEAVRDSVLHVTGALRSRMQGPGYSVFEPNTNYVRNYIPREKWGPAQWRRMIYMTKVRMERDAVFGVLDCPDAGQVASQRARSTTPLQALNLLNSSFMLQQAELMAKSIVTEVPNSATQQVRQVFRRILDREPGKSELAGAMALANSHGLRAVCRALLNSNEFLFLQ